MKKITKFTAADLIEELHANNNLGIAYNQSGIPLQTMTFREFLTWYADATNIHLSIEDGTYYDEDHETEVDTCNLVERCSGKKLNSAQFFSEEEARDAYYERLERRYNDDNGAGGIWYDNAEAIVRLEDDNDEWHELFEQEENEQ